MKIIRSQNEIMSYCNELKLKTSFVPTMGSLHDGHIRLLEEGKNIMVVAHGNSIRAILKVLKKIPDEEIIKLNIPTGIPLVLELSSKLQVVNDYYLGNLEEINKKTEAVKSEGLSSN